MDTFERYRRFLSSLPARGEYDPAELLVPDLLIAEQGPLRMFYAPFDWFNSSARLFILGITPGWTQMEIACRTVRNALAGGQDVHDACRFAKQQASFAGRMRHNLIEMLDSLGLPGLLEIGSAGELFDGASHLLHTGSALRYPVFVGQENYTGSNPPVAKSPFLLRVARELLAPELESLPRAAIVPLGRSVEDVLDVLAVEGHIKRKRWLKGFPHPSGANAHRKWMFAQNHDSLAQQLQQILERGTAA